MKTFLTLIVLLAMSLIISGCEPDDDDDGYKKSLNIKIENKEG